MRYYGLFETHLFLINTVGSSDDAIQALVHDWESFPLHLDGLNHESPD
jgi:hypothetical protein